MREVGEVESADRFFDWCARVVLARPTGPWDARYTLDGERDTSSWPKLQTDGLGLLLWALRRRGTTRWDDAAQLVRAWLELHWRGTERRLVGGARRHSRLDALVHRGGARLGRDPARSDRSRRRPARRLAALHRHAGARRARREHTRLSGWRRLAQPRRRVLRRRRMGAPDRDARPRPADARRGRAWPGSRPTRRRTATCPSRRRTTCCGRSGISPGSRNGARRRPRCSGRMRCTFDCTMPSETVRCAIVGSGLAALATYATLRRGGVQPEEIAVYGTHEDPTEVWRARAAAIRQQRMRSESDGHVARSGVPRARGSRSRARTDSGAARCDRREPLPPARRGFPRSTPSRCVRASGWEQSFRRERIDRITPVDDGFAVDGATFRHVLVATGHPGLAQPPEYAGAVHAYEPHDYAPKVAVVGAGMAAATEWLNALAAGSEVVSIRRREPLRRRAQRPARVLLEARARRVPRCERRAPRGDAARALDAVLSARGRVGRAGRRRRGGRALHRHGTGSRRRAGDLRHRLPQGLARGPAARETWSRRTTSRPMDAGSHSRPTRPSRS